MTDETITHDIPSIMSHVSIGVSDYPAAKAFYTEVLATVGAKVMMDIEEVGAIAFGKFFAEFWVQVPHDGQAPSAGNGSHFAFFAPNKAAVDAFWAKAIELGASPDGEPGPRPHYGEAYYGCFLRDADGNKIEAMFWNGPLETP